MEEVCLKLLNPDLGHSWRLLTIYSAILRGQMNRVVITVLCWDSKFTTPQKTKKARQHGAQIMVL